MTMWEKDCVLYWNLCFVCVCVFVCLCACTCLMKQIKYDHIYSIFSLSLDKVFILIYSLISNSNLFSVYSNSNSNCNSNSINLIKNYLSKYIKVVQIQKQKESLF
jgi:hypothetical protein